MKKLIFIILFIPAIATAQVPDTSSVTEKAVNSIEDIAASIISDSFNPMTHYSKGDKSFYFVPGWFKADRVMEDPDVDADGFTGMSLGTGGGYALNDRLMTYIILAGMKMEGELRAPFYGTDTGNIPGNFDYSLVSLLGGAGYDIFKNDFISVPVYFGANIQHYSAKLVPMTVDWDSGAGSFLIDSTIKGSGFLLGMSGGIALSLKIYDFVKITPYFIYMQNLNKAKMEAEITNNTNPLLSGKQSFDVDPVSSGMLGLNMGVISEGGFSFTVSAGSMISSMMGFGNKATSNGVDMKSVILIFGYSY
jgi:hypothetical protein